MSHETDERTRPPIPDRPLLRGEKVWLRPLEERDLPAYVAGINDSEVGGLAGYKAPMSLEQAKGWLDHVNEQGKGGRGFFFAVCELGDDQFIGTTWLKDVDYWHGSAELAIFMDRDHLGAGFGTDAQRVLLDFAFTAVGLHRVWLTAYAANQRAIRSYEKLGFRHEGLMRESWRGPRGLEDSVIMAILAADWNAAAGRG
ncbi:MAG TPA: GNAT family protein [Candidatus Limnocylindria bacterium]|jgi:RimJ/RimL family protein N-acetyltransferase